MRESERDENTFQMRSPTASRVVGVVCSASRACHRACQRSWHVAIFPKSLLSAAGKCWNVLAAPNKSRESLLGGKIGVDVELCVLAVS